MNKNKIIDRFSFVNPKHKSGPLRLDPNDDNSWFKGSRKIWIAYVGYLLTNLIPINLTPSDTPKDTLSYMITRHNAEDITPFYLSENPSVIDDIIAQDEKTFDFRALEESIYKPTDDKSRSIIDNKGLPAHLESTDEVFFSGNYVTTHFNMSEQLWYFPNSNILYDMGKDNMYSFDENNEELISIADEVISIREFDGKTHVMKKDGDIYTFEGGKPYEFVYDNTSLDKEYKNSNFRFFKNIYGTEYVAAMNSDNNFRILNLEDNTTPHFHYLMSKLTKKLSKEEIGIDKIDQIAYLNSTLYYNDVNGSLYAVNRHGIQEYEGGEISDMGALRETYYHPADTDKKQPQYKHYLGISYDQDDEYLVHKFSGVNLEATSLTQTEVDFDKLKHTRWLSPHNFKEQLKQRYLYND